MSQLSRKFSELSRAFSKATDDPESLNVCVKVLGELKTKLVCKRLDDGDVSQNQLIEIRKVYEIGALVSVLKNDIDGFHFFYAQLHFLYFEIELPSSELMCSVIGMNLLYLLMENRIGDFYMLLELTPVKVRLDPNVAYLVQLEQSMADGNYTQLLEIESTSPCEYYKVVAPMLAHTARMKIAAVMELAYGEILVEAAMEKLKIRTVGEFELFVMQYNRYKTQVGAPGSLWNVKGNVLETNTNTVRSKVNREPIIARSIRYLKHLEEII